MTIIGRLARLARGRSRIREAALGAAVVALGVVGLTGCADEIEVASEQPAVTEASEQVEQQSAEQQAELSASDEASEVAAEEQDAAAVDENGDEPVEVEERALPRGVTTFLPRDATETAEGLPIIRDGQTPEFFGLDWRTNWGIRLIALDELGQGAPRDAIPALSNPLYVTLEEASAIYDDQEPVVQVKINGDVRGFPLEILTWHEIVNDVIGGIPITVTFCPLCNTAIAFESQIGDEVYRFGVSGLLRNSDLVMYDQNTDSLWQQSSGRAIVGVMVGARLSYVPASVVTVGQLRSAYPDALVLSRETGWSRSYGRNPYEGYDDPESGGPYYYFYDRDAIDERLPPAERVVSIEGASGAAVAYPWSALEQLRALHDSFDGAELVVFWTPGARSILDAGLISSAREVGTTAVFERTLNGRRLTFAVNPADESEQTFVDAETGSVWDIFGRATSGELAGSELTRVIHSDHFWFAWQAFHPGTAVVSGDPSP